MEKNANCQKAVLLEFLKEFNKMQLADSQSDSDMDWRY